MRFLAMAIMTLVSTMAFSGQDNRPTAFNDADLEKLRLAIFAGEAAKPSCKAVSRGPGVKLEALDASLQQFAANLLECLKNGKEEQLETYFHPRLKDKGNIGRRLFATLRSRYATPWDFSVTRIFALNTVNGDKTELTCHADDIAITTLYGYPLQFGVIFGMMAQNELSRIFALVVPRDGVWYIGGFHIQQWTFMTKDFEVWTAEGLDAMKAGDPMNAYIKFDIAQKMLFGGDFLSYPIKEKILASRSVALTKEAFLTKIQEAAKNGAIVYAGTALLNDGPGIIIRERLTKDATTPELKDSCHKSAKNLLDAGVIKGDMGGVQCDFIYPGDNAKKQGQLGGFYLARKEIGEAVTAIPPVTPTPVIPLAPPAKK